MHSLPPIDSPLVAPASFAPTMRMLANMTNEFGPAATLKLVRETRAAFAALADRIESLFPQESWDLSYQLVFNASRNETIAMLRYLDCRAREMEVFDAPA